MNRILARGLSAALLAGAVAPAAAADDPPADPPRPPARGTLFGKLFGPKPPAAPKGMSAVPPAPPNPLPPEILADALRAEQEAWGRRVAVCTELRRIGEETNNDQLIRQADDLERQATAVYNQRVTALGVPKVRAPLPEAPAVALDKTLGTGAAVSPLTAPAAPTPLDPGTGTAEAKPAADHGVREVKP
jgi:hypothetical protein